MPSAANDRFSATIEVFSEAGNKYGGRFLIGRPHVEDGLLVIPCTQAIGASDYRGASIRIRIESFAGLIASALRAAEPPEYQPAEDEADHVVT